MFYQKPPLGSQVDWSHPIAKGLVSAVLFNEFSGNAIWDYAQMRLLPTTGGPTWGDDGMIFDADAECIDTGVYPYESWSVFGKIYLIAEDNDKQLFWGAGATSNYAWFGLYNPSDFLWITAGATFQKRDVASGMVAGNYYTVCHTFDGEVGRGYVDGVLIDSIDGGWVGGPNTDSWVIANYKASSLTMSGKSRYQMSYIWDRALLDHEILLLQRDPYCIFQPSLQWELLGAAAAPELTQYSYRFRNDDGDEDEATWKASEDTNINLSPGNIARLRCLIDASGDLGNKAFQLEYRYKPSGESFGNWKKITE